MRLSAYLSVLAEPPLPILIVIALFGWIMMLQQGHTHGMSEYIMASKSNGYSQVLHTALHSNLLIIIGESWLTMLVAMMTPLLADPLRHLWIRSLSRRRWIAVVLFLTGYITIWMLAGVVLMLFTTLLLLLSGRWVAAPVLTLALAIAWQTTPWKQACLNHCHWTPRLSPFGLAANLDCLRYGIVNGLWCIGACWALMLLPLVTIHANQALMTATATSLIIMVERYRPARPTRWQIPIFG